MKRIFISLLMIVALAACGQNRPKPLSIEEIPPLFKKTFVSAREEARFVIDGIIKQVEHKQYAPASFQLQNMLSDRTLSSEQHSVISRGLMTLNAEIQKQTEIQEVAATPVDASSAPQPSMPTPAEAAAANPKQSQAEADAFLRMYRRTK